MTSPRSNDASSIDPSYNNLINRVLRLVRRPSARERILAAELARAFLERAEVQRQVEIAAAAAESTPPQITRILRSPAGTDCVAVVAYDGMIIKAVLHPSGKRNPSREAAVWRCLRDKAEETRKRREQHQ